MTSGLVFVGLGLCGPDGMTVKAMNALKECDKIYAEFYTSFLIGTSVKDLEDAIGKKIAIKLPWLISWGIGTLYALTDEWHQGFVGGRHPALLDVTIDSCGVAVGVLVLVLLLRRRNRPLP